MPRSDIENTIDRAVQLGRDNQQLISLIEAHCTDARVVHPHGLRHTCPAELALEGVPVLLIQQQLGHASSLHTTTVYLHHIAPVELAESMRRGSCNP